MSREGVLCFSMSGNMQESGPTETLPFTCISALWGWYPVFFFIYFFHSPLRPPTPQFLNAPVGSGCSSMGGWIAGIVLLRCFLGSEIHSWRARVAVMAEMALSLICQEILYLSLGKNKEGVLGLY